MAPSDAIRRATKKYLTEKVDSITLRVPKGYKAIIESIAKSKGLSVNSYLTTIIDQEIQKEIQ
mgnify:CR=1 FL=1